MADLQRDQIPYSRHGFGAIRPYLYGGLDVADFVANVFGAKMLERHKHEGRHAFHMSSRLRTRFDFGSVGTSA